MLCIKYIHSFSQRAHKRGHVAAQAVTAQLQRKQKFIVEYLFIQKRKSKFELENH